MIGYLKGTIKYKQESLLILETASGVGYAVNMVTGEIDLKAETVEVFIHTAVKEDDISLWGFSNLEDLKLFRLLLGVSGVGLRTAQALLEVVGLRSIVVSISNDDPAGLKAPGVGKKTAERIILDLRNRLDQFVIDAEGTGESTASANKMSSQLVKDAMEAVESLGYLRKDIESVVRELELEGYKSAQELVKSILKHI